MKNIDKTIADEASGNFFKNLGIGFKKAGEFRMGTLNRSKIW